MPDETPRRLPQRAVKVTLPEPYQEFTVTLWANLPQRLWRDMMGTDFAACAAAFGRMVLDHDLVDDEGRPFPPGGSPDLYRELPADLVAVINSARVGQIGKLSPPSAGNLKAG